MIISADEQQSVIAAVCRKYGIERLLIVGSKIREDFRTKNNAA
jgi:predicted nucleotidyltransferase